MSFESFETLHDIIKSKCQVDIKKSMAGTANEVPATLSEVVVACGLRFLGGEDLKTLSDLYGMSDKTAYRLVFTRFLPAIDSSCHPLLTVKLPSTSEELCNCTAQWGERSTAGGCFDGGIGAIDGWLCCTDAPSTTYVSNTTDYFSGHYHRYGLNVQAVCDGNLRFLYFGVLGPGKTGDARALTRATTLIKWLEDLPDKYFLVGDNAYQCTRKVVIPFSGADKNIPENDSFNFYLSQLRTRIEMTFGLLTTKWRIFRRNLNYSPGHNSLIIRVAMTLHNFVIDSDHINRIHVEDDYSALHIVPLSGSTVAYLAHEDEEEDIDDEQHFNNIGEDTATSRRTEIVEELKSLLLQRPTYNVEQNQQNQLQLGN